jgi:L-ascorbate metabolism protein UlaG (beta-lactamase superfamily)
MTQTRRAFFVTAAVAAGVTTVLPYAALAAGHSGDIFETDGGPITVHPINHASVVLETPAGTIYVDPIGEAAQYAGLPDADLILITHEHSDHYNAETIAALMGENTSLITNPAVQALLPVELGNLANAMANGDSTEFNGVGINAIPAYNTTEERLKFHPHGRDNGYILNFEGFRIYISGDTEDTAEMRALENIDLAFICMNLPFTMDAAAAADAVKEFRPTYVYPYHYQGRDGGTQDPAEFAELVGDAADVKLGGWYE